MGGVERYGASDGAAWSLRRQQHGTHSLPHRGAEGSDVAKNLYCTNCKIIGECFRVVQTF